MVRSIDRTGASPVPPASSRTGPSVSRRKKDPLGPVNEMVSPTEARCARYSDIAPPGVSLTRKVSRVVLG